MRAENIGSLNRDVRLKFEYLRPIHPQGIAAEHRAKQGCYQQAHCTLPHKSQARRDMRLTPAAQRSPCWDAEFHLSTLPIMIVDRRVLEESRPYRLARLWPSSRESAVQ